MSIHKKLADAEGYHRRHQGGPGVYRCEVGLSQAPSGWSRGL